MIAVHPVGFLFLLLVVRRRCVGHDRLGLNYWSRTMMVVRQFAAVVVVVELVVAVVVELVAVAVAMAVSIVD